MSQHTIKFLLSIVFLSYVIIFPGNVFGQKNQMKVGIAGSPPFVITYSDQEANPSGISVEVFEKAIEALDVEYSYERYTTVGEALGALRESKIDILVGPVSVTTDRMVDFAFSRPYFSSAIVAALPATTPDLWQRIKPFFTQAVLTSLAILIFILTIVGTVVWFAEHKHNQDEFPSDLWPGIGAGMWFALVTLTTVGYGDKSPKTTLGKICTSLWMLTSLVTVSSLTAGLASAFTVSMTNQGSQISKVEELRNHKVGAIKASSSESAARRIGIRNIMAVRSVEEGLQKVSNGSIKAFLADRPYLKYFLDENDELEVAISDFVLAEELYAFTFRKNSDLEAQVSKSLVSMRETGSLETILERWR